ncbi:MAG: DUF2949 domain-containing protein [Prochloraceae cyanobacterium]
MSLKKMLKKMIGFLKNDLAISSRSIRFAHRRSLRNSSTLALVLWQYGLITLEQLDVVFDWIENQDSIDPQ